MNTLELPHLGDQDLLQALQAVVEHDRASTANVLAYLAEMDARRLHRPAGYPSMHAYCVEALHFSDGAAYKRIHAARVARRFPEILAAVADGRLHLSAVCLLATHFTAENVDELIAAATHRRRADIERWLEERFAPPLLIAACAPPGLAMNGAVRAASAAQQAPGRVAPNPPLARHVVVRLVMPEAAHARLRHAQDLLSHAVPKGDLAQVVARAIELLIRQLEKRKFAASARPRPRRAAGRPAKRTIPAQVRRAVWERDEGRCAYVSLDGRRCGTRRRLEFDHMDPVARGGKPVAERVRLLCRAHNQFEVERIFGDEFMRGKREAGRSRGTSWRDP